MQVPGEALIGKLWDTIADKGIGALLRPWQMRREGRVQIEMKCLELLSLAQAEREAAAIRRGDVSLHTAVAVPLLVQTTPLLPEAMPLAPPETLGLDAPRITAVEIASRNAVADSIDREVNVAKAILRAEDELGADSSAPPPTLASDDWLCRWKEYASSVRSDELQSLWGRVLAGEVKAPGKYSVRFLHFLHNLSQEEANLIAQAMSFVVGDFIYRAGSSYMESAGIDFSAILRLQELGVLAGAEAIGLSKTFTSADHSSYVNILMSNGLAIGIRGTDPKVVLEVPAYVITSLGGQLGSIGTFEPHIDYIRALGTYIKGKGFTVEIGKPIRMLDGQIKIITPETL